MHAIGAAVTVSNDDEPLARRGSPPTSPRRRFRQLPHAIRFVTDGIVTAKVRGPRRAYRRAPRSRPIAGQPNRTPASEEPHIVTNVASFLPSDPRSAVVGKSSRLLSVDLLRGIDLCFMILVNNNGDDEHAFSPLKHAQWNGFTPTDLVFPTFLFLVGVSLVFATESRLARGVSKSSIFLGALRRAVILYLLGLLVNSFPFFHLGAMRFYGVLHRIAICYLIASILLLLLDRGWRSKAAILVACLAGYWILMRFVPVPGYGIPTHTVPLLDRDGNLAAVIDRSLFSANHLFERTRDPEGLLSTIPAVGTILLGVLTGLWIRTSRTLTQKIRGIATAGISSVVLGLLWNPWFPINKKLWTSSYVLFAGGLSLLLLALTMFLVDRHPSGEPDTDRHRSFRLLFPFFVLGTNSIAAYVISELLAGALGSVRVGAHSNVLRWTYTRIHAAIPDAAFASLAFSILFVVVCWIPVYGLYRKRIFLKV